MADTAPGPELLARGPWDGEQVRVSWQEEHFAPSAEHSAAADAKIAALKERGSPSHDGLAVRLHGYSVAEDGALDLTLQPLRWALRLVEHDASGSMSALCITRAAPSTPVNRHLRPWAANSTRSGRSSQTAFWARR